MYVLNVRPLYHIPRDVLVSFELGVPFSSVMCCPLMICLPRLICSVRFWHVPSVNDVQSALIDIWSSFIVYRPLMMRLPWLKHRSVQLWLVPTVMCPWLDCYIVSTQFRYVVSCSWFACDLISVLFRYNFIRSRYAFAWLMYRFRSIPLYSVRWWDVWPDW